MGRWGQGEGGRVNLCFRLNERTLRARGEVIELFIAICNLWLDNPFFGLVDHYNQLCYDRFIFSEHFVIKIFRNVSAK